MIFNIIAYILIPVISILLSIFFVNYNLFMSIRINLIFKINSLDKFSGMNIVDDKAGIELVVNDIVSLSQQFVSIRYLWFYEKGNKKVTSLCDRISKEYYKNGGCVIDVCPSPPTWITDGTKQITESTGMFT